MTTDICSSRVLSDEPAAEDAFGTGGHRRVAESISSVVRTEAGGRAIGLEGSWGSGKSSVVAIALTDLEDASDPEVGAFVFDIWSHQGDPLRRSFLESLIERLIAWEWVDSATWERKRDELAGRRSEEKHRVVPQLTSWGLILALALLALPVGAGVLSAGLTLLASDRTSAESTLGRAPEFVTVIGVGVVLAPVFVITAMLIWRFYRRSDSDGISSDLPAFVTGQATTETQTIVTRTPDPTSVEFQHLFQQLMSDALTEPSRRILIVVDNLDRVDRDDALSIWSTLQTFLQRSHHQELSWVSQLWVLVPYDPNGIGRLWPDEPAEAGRLADSFIDKTFQVRLRVPPPVLSEWRGFLRAQIESALPDHDPSEFSDVYWVFAANSGMETAAPTPRELKLFVNQVVTLHQQHGHELRLADYANYALLAERSSEVLEVLRGNEELPIVPLLVSWTLR